MRYLMSFSTPQAALVFPVAVSGDSLRMWQGAFDGCAATIAAIRGHMGAGSGRTEVYFPAGR
jgi:hypothetical protein